MRQFISCEMPFVELLEKLFTYTDQTEFVMQEGASVKNCNKVLIADFVLFAFQLPDIKAEFVCPETTSFVENVSLERLV